MLRRIVATKHESLRLTVLNERAAYEEAKKAFNSPWVGLVTLNMEALKKAMPDRSGKALDKPEESYQEKWERQQRERKVARKQCDVLLRVGASTISQSLPNQAPILELFAQTLQNYHQAIEDFSSQWEKANLSRKREMIASLLICRLGSYNVWSPKPKDIQNGTQELATRLGISLPEGWAQSVLPAPKTKRGAK